MITDHWPLFGLRLTTPRLELRVPDHELNARRMQWQPPPPAYARGYGKLFLDHVLQAHRGCDFDFLLPEE